MNQKPKINREEYEVLKELDDKWKWIARDEDGEAFMYECEPYRVGTIWNFDDGVHNPLRHEDHFQFIQWEDEEPHNIQELIEEYEEHEFYNYVEWEYYRWEYDKREETEVKNIEWLKEEIEGKIRNYESFSDKTNWNHGYIMALHDYKDLIDQLDEPEVLSQELPVIPKFVADYIQSSKGEDITLFSAMRDAFVDDENKIHDWLWDGSGDDSFQTFARAWLDYPNIEVEVEQKYQVKDNHGRTLLAKMTYSHKGKTFEEVQPYNELIVGYKKELSEQEIKDYDERFWPFAVPVEEMETRF